MLTKAKDVRTDNQNIGLVDRVARFSIGSVMLGTGLAYLGLGPTVFAGAAEATWMTYVVVLSVYPLMTAILGIDPLYHFFKFRSGGNTGRNQCGSFPYQIKAAFNSAPQFCEDNDERSLGTCHDEAREQPQHAMWKVEQDPMLYPSDASMAKFSDHEKGVKARRS